MKDIVKKLYRSVNDIVIEYNNSAGTNFTRMDELMKHVMNDIHVKNKCHNIYTLLNSYVDGFEIVDMSVLKEENPDKFEASGAMNWKWFEAEIRPNKYIYYRPDKHSISFTMQSQIDQINGCTISAVIETAKLMLEAINHTHRCREISTAITKIEEALMWINKRRYGAVDKLTIPIIQL